MKDKQKFYVFVAILLAATAFAATSINFTDGWEWTYPYNPNPTPTTTVTPTATPTFSTLPPTTNPTGQPTNTPTNTPIQTSTPTPTPIAKPTIKLWQALYVTNTDGTTYWVQPNIQIGTQTILAKNGVISKAISNVQNAIYTQADFHGRTVASIKFDCHEVIKLTTTSDALVKQIVSTDVSMTVNNPIENVAFAVTSSQITSSQLQTLLQTNGAGTSTPYYFVIELSNVKLTVTFSDGTIGLLQSTQKNTLKWEVTIV